MTVSHLIVTSKIGVAIIGYGYWGPNYARVFNELPEACVKIICDSQPERLQRAASRFPHIDVTADAHEAIRRADVDAIIISTPATSHFELAQFALKAGRHVIVEKPLALKVEQCRVLGDLALNMDRVLMVAHTFLYNPGVQKLRECLKSPAFGRVYYLHSTRTNLGPIRRDINAIWDLAPHDISIFGYLLDEIPIWASAIGLCVLGNPREDVGFITLGYQNNVIGNIHVSWADPNKVREVVVVGSQQRVVFDDLNDLERLRIFEKGVSVGELDADSFGDFKLQMRDGDIISPKIQYSEPLKNQAIDFITAISQSTSPISDATTGENVVRTLKAVEASMRQRGAEVGVS